MADTKPTADSTRLGAVQVVDPVVSQEKFDAELAAYRLLARKHQERGWWLLEAEFPQILVALLTSRLAPPAVVCGVLFDFTNYDLEPPSVRLVDPFTRRPYLNKELPTALLRQQVVQAPGMPQGIQVQQVTPLMQAHGPDEIPFLCIAGVREYHEHPAHTGDSWLSHRGRGEGTLYSILSAIYQYGVQPIADYSVGLRVVGFQQGEPPR